MLASSRKEAPGKYLLWISRVKEEPDLFLMSPKQNRDFWERDREASSGHHLAVFQSWCCWTAGRHSGRPLWKWVTRDGRRGAIQRLPVLGGEWAEVGSSPHAPSSLGCAWGTAGAAVMLTKKPSSWGFVPPRYPKLLRLLYTVGFSMWFILSDTDADRKFKSLNEELIKFLIS